MPKVTDQPTKPPRTWRPMALWTAGILLALGLCWFVTAVAIPMYRVGDIVRGASGEPMRYVVVPTNEERIEQLGGPKRAAAMIRFFLRSGTRTSEERMKAAYLMGYCGEDVVPDLILALSDPDGNVRKNAAQALRRIGPDAQEAVPALEKEAERARAELLRKRLDLFRSPEADASRAALEALGEIRGEETPK